MIQEAAERRCEFLLAREASVEKREAEMKAWARLRQILEIRYGDRWPDGDIEILVRRTDLVMSGSPDEAFDKAEIKP